MERSERVDDDPTKDTKESSADPDDWVAHTVDPRAISHLVLLPKEKGLALIKDPLVPCATEWVCGPETYVDVVHRLDQFLDTLEHCEGNHALIVVIKRRLLGAVLGEESCTEFPGHESVAITFIGEPQEVDDERAKEDDDKGEEKEDTSAEGVKETGLDGSCGEETEEHEDLVHSHQRKHSHGRELDARGATK